jgi:hypothetical protein
MNLKKLVRWKALRTSFPLLPSQPVEKVHFQQLNRAKKVAVFERDSENPAVKILYITEK